VVGRLRATSCGAWPYRRRFLAVSQHVLKAGFRAGHTAVPLGPPFSRWIDKFLAGLTPGDQFKFCAPLCVSIHLGPGQSHYRHAATRGEAEGVGQRNIDTSALRMRIAPDADFCQFQQFPSLGEYVATLLVGVFALLFDFLADRQQSSPSAPEREIPQFSIEPFVDFVFIAPDRVFR
jgi:hypothetical protein